MRTTVTSAMIPEEENDTRFLYRAWKVVQITSSLINDSEL